MTSRMDEFRAFIKKYPELREEVKSNSTSWQKVYEDWVVLGENDERFTKYNNSNRSSSIGSKRIDDLLTTGNIKNIVDYVKKINPDSISKTLNTVQKVLQITQSFGSKPNPGLYNSNYNSWWD